jgi:phage/plasmid-like protein (TIGR03299 family)
MAHEVETAFYAGDPAWHGLGTVVADAKSSKEAVRLAGLDWEVIQEQMVLESDGKVVPDRLANVRSTDRRILGIVSDHYKYDQPAKAFEFTDALLENDEVEVLYDAAGSLFSGKRIWICAHLPERLILGDRIGTHIVFATSYDGSLANTVVVTPNRVDCNNMLTMAINGASRKWSYKHIGNVIEKKKEVAKTLGLTCKYMDALNEKAEMLQQVKVTPKKLNQIIEIVFPMDNERSDRAQNNVSLMRNQFTDIYTQAPDLKKFRGDAWGVYNAFADFASHVKPLRETKMYQEKLFSSFIDGNKFMLKAQKAIEKIAA